MNSIKDKNKELYRQLKYYWKKLLTSYDELDNSTHKKFKYFKYITTGQDIVNYLIKQDPQLYKCYWLTQDLREALEKERQAILAKKKKIKLKRKNRKKAILLNIA